MFFAHCYMKSSIPMCYIVVLLFFYLDGLSINYPMKVYMPFKERKKPHKVSSNIFYLIKVISLHTVIWFQVTMITCK